MENLLIESQLIVKRTPLQFKRYLLKKINWNNRLIAIKGARGVGKTTLLLQHIALNHKQNTSVLYVSLEHQYFYENKLISLADEFYKNGGKYLMLDEVHKYPNWSREIKLIYDNYPELSVVFTSSSILDIYKGESDLSRRAVSYNLDNLSLREYIEFNSGEVFPVYTFNDIIENHSTISAEILDKIKPIFEFNNYVKYGTYPYFKEGLESYYQKLVNTINLIIEVDINTIHNLDYQLIYKAKHLLYAIASSVPFTPNISKLSERISISRPTLLKALKYLQQALLIILANKHKKGISILSKPDKIYLNNTNLIYALAKDNADIGNIRETFFINQLLNSNKIDISEIGDFIVNDKYIFEIGGKNKKQSQIKDAKNAFIVKDNIELGVNNVIPLWLFGFLY